MVKIAMIDDGIPEYLDLKFPDFKIYHMCVRNQKIHWQKFGSLVRRISHGGLCFQELASRLTNYRVELYSINVISSKDGRGDITNLICALKWCIDNDVGLINMSIGTTNYFDYQLLEPLLEELEQQGKIVVAAHSNEYAFSSPANSPYAIGVRFDNSNTLKKNSHYMVKNRITNAEVIYSKKELGCIEKYINLDDECNSFAVPILSAQIFMLLCEKNFKKVDLLKYLARSSNNSLEMWEVRKRYITDKEINIPVIFLNCKNCKELLKELLDLFGNEGYRAFALTNNTTQDDIRYINLLSAYIDCQKKIKNAVTFIQCYSKADILLVKSEEEYVNELYEEKIIDIIVTDTKQNYAEDIIIIDRKTKAKDILEVLIQILS